MVVLKRVHTNKGVVIILEEGSRFYLFFPPYDPEWGRSSGGHEDEISKLGKVIRAYRGDPTKIIITEYKSGEFHPRIYRGDDSPKPIEAGFQSQWIETVRSTRILYFRLREIFEFIEPNSNIDMVYSHRLRELLILACTEVESAWISILKSNGANISKQLFWSTKDYIKLLQPLRLNEWGVNLSSQPNYPIISPFKYWYIKSPTKSLLWYNAYNSVKHGRESSLEEAMLSHVLYACAAAFIMTIAQFGKDHLAEGQIFHPDIFKIVNEPKWNPEECYVPPLIGYSPSTNGKWLGYEKWIPRKLFNAT